MLKVFLFGYDMVEMTNTESDKTQGYVTKVSHHDGVLDSIISYDMLKFYRKMIFKIANKHV